jgi:hypothetical protein
VPFLCLEGDGASGDYASAGDGIIGVKERFGALGLAVENSLVLAVLRKTNEYAAAVDCSHGAN